MTTISTAVDTAIILGSANYGSPLTITASGTIATASAGQSSIFVPATVSAAKISNAGKITGGPGGTHYGSAGTGITARSALNLANTGTIDGGSDNTQTNTNEAGAAGIDLLAGGSVSNSGAIVGGNSGGSDMQPSSPGGDGADLRHVSLSNTGTIAGGSGGFSLHGTVATGSGGIGVSLSATSTGINHGQITGGAGGYTDFSGGAGGIGVQIANSRFTNAGTIAGGKGSNKGLGMGGVGANLFSGGNLSNTGIVLGGYAGTDRFERGTLDYYYGGKGGAGVSLHGATLTNSGTIHGGNTYGTLSAGGAGVFIEGGMVTNTGTIVGGASNNIAGDGIDMIGGTVLSTGSITGGSYEEFVAFGGIGVSVDTGTLIASGTITGGYGFLTGPATQNYPGNAGAGVYLNGGTVIASGSIDGGGLYGQSGPTNADAVAFGTLAGTLVIRPTATFSGQVAATAGAGDALVLAGNGGTLAGLGTQFTGFDTLTVAANSAWSLAGTSALTLDLSVVDNSHLAVAPAVSGTGTITLASGANLTAEQAVSGVGVAFGGAAHLRLADTSGFASTITGLGTGDVIDLQLLAVTSASFANGTLTLLDNSATVGSLAFAGTFTTGNFALAKDGAGGTNVSFLASSAQPSLLPDFSAAGAASWAYAASSDTATRQVGSFDEHQLLAIGHAWVHAA